MFRSKDFGETLSQTLDYLIKNQSDAVYMGYELEAAKQQYAAQVVQELINAYEETQNEHQS